jgi:drug/metabolite transporter (DMT)-like permease
MSARAWFNFGAVCLLWGIPYFFIKIAVDDGVPPAFLAWVRVTLAAVILVTLCWRLGLLTSLRGRRRAVIAFALLEIAIPFPLIAAGEQHVASSLTAILIATVPLNVALLAPRFDPAERATGIRLVGLLVGFAGVVIVVSRGDLARLGSGSVGDGEALMFAAVVSWALYTIGGRKVMGGLSPLAATTYAALWGTLSLALLAAPRLGDLSAAQFDWRVILSLLYLGVLGTAVAFVWYYMSVKKLGASVTSVFNNLVPVFGVAISVVLLGEPLLMSMLVGGAVTIVGVMMVSRM